MQTKKLVRAVSVLFVLLFLGSAALQAQDNSGAQTVPARMTVSVRLLGENKRMPQINRDDVVVRQGKDKLQVTRWTAARSQNADLDLFILIDDAADPSLGIQLAELRSFINAQPPGALVGVGYMRNGTVQIAQNFTPNHDQAANALRLPIASTSAYGSPYLSVIDLMKRWPDNSNRRQIVIITDGIDRFRSTPLHRGLRYISPDVDSASSVAQRTGTTIHSVFTRGIGRLGSNYWEILNGQTSISKLSAETGGESYYLGMQNAVSFKPYLDALQTTLDNQYILEFNAPQPKKSSLQYVKLATEVAGVELDSADSVWVDAD